MNINELCLECRKASFQLAGSDTALRNKVLTTAADMLEQSANDIIEENRKDLLRAEQNGMKSSFIDRLALNQARIHDIADGMRHVASLPDPLGGGDVWTRPNGLEIKRLHVPLGVIGIIYEARPNVTADAAALCIKSGNGVVLRGGSDAINSNVIISSIIKNALCECGLSGEAVQLIHDTSRDSSTALMKAKGYIDLLIPRGGKGLIRSVTDNAEVPVIETGAGNCHIYVESTADLDMALSILVNAKTSRPSVCNAVEHLLVDKAIAGRFLPMVKNALTGVLLRGDSATREYIDIDPADDADFDTEYDDLILSIKIVENTAVAIEHINAHSTKHSEAIITNDVKLAKLFTSSVDSAAVYVNASTRFTDGGEFGFGAEIGISTQKLHARGPMGLNELTTIKYIINGNGQIR